MILSRSLFPLVLLTAILSVGSSVIALHGMPVPKETEILQSLAFQFILVCWVRVDRLARGFRVPYEFDAFVFFAWPIVVPYYLYKTRGVRGLLFAVGIGALFLMPSLAAAVIKVSQMK